MEKIKVHRSIGQWIHYALTCAVMGHQWVMGRRYLNGYFPHCADCGEPYNSTSRIPFAYCYCSKCSERYGFLINI